MTDGVGTPMRPIACDDTEADWRITGIVREQRPVGEVCPDPDGPTWAVPGEEIHVLCIEELHPTPTATP